MEENAKILLGIKDPNVKILKLGEEKFKGINYKVVEVKIIKKMCGISKKFSMGIIYG